MEAILFTFVNCYGFRIDKKNPLNCLHLIFFGEFTDLNKAIHELTEKTHHYMKLQKEFTENARTNDLYSLGRQRSTYFNATI